MSTLKIGDLLSIDGEWVKEGEILANGREAAERRFLDGYDPGPE